jgi:hypothetical protein
MKHHFKSSPLGKFREIKSHDCGEPTATDYGHYVRFIHCLDREARQMSAANALKWLVHFRDDREGNCCGTALLSRLTPVCTDIFCSICDNIHAKRS